ncbi:MAG: TraR/DksA C4-type zinc finger protein, partial [Sporomusaceae bacterium]|nr:TraR/DksA C4-type zinc finger protein [Sporomusaceae bacterium]
APVDEVFSYKKVDADLTECARIFSSVNCAICGEAAPEHKIRVQEGKQVCLDCFQEYTRGW